MAFMKKHLKFKTHHVVFAAAIALFAAISIDAAVYVNKGGIGNGPKSFQLGSQPVIQAGLNPFSTGTMATFVVRKSPRDFANLEFKDGAGKELSLKDWRGKVVLLNLWATWCAPCRREMPELDRLQGAMGGDNFEVVAVSIDRKGVGVVEAFLTEIKTENLRIYIDQSSKVARDSEAFGMPTTILIDRNGKELGRMIGPAEWDSNQAKALITAAMRGKLLSADVH